MVRGALKAALGTLDRRTGHPYASLVTVATEPDGTPVFLISRLAVHTRNLMQDGRASLLFDGTGASGDPLAGGRVTLVGTAAPIDPARARARFLARHPASEMYVDFPDFDFYALTPASAHYVGGFGRIVDLKRDDLVLAADACAELAAAEAEIVAHMNTDHSQAVSLYATGLLAAYPGAWKMCGIDPEGIDLTNENATLRLPFARPVRTAEEARAELVRLAKLARKPDS